MLISSATPMTVGGLYRLEGGEKVAQIVPGAKLGSLSLRNAQDKTVSKTLHIRTTVQPGGKIEIVDQELTEGESVDVVVGPASAVARRSKDPF